MSKTATVNVASVDNKEIWIACGECGRETCHKVLTLVNSTDEHRIHSVCWWDDYMTVQCFGCRIISFCHEHTFSEDFGQDPDTGEEILVPTRKLYPGRLAGRPQLQEAKLLPQKVLQIYKETHAALCDELPILAGIGIRAIVETVCKEKLASGKNLEQQIDSLVSMGLITQDGSKILHNLRFMGNKAAHEVTAHGDIELNVAFNVVEYLLEGVYIIPQLAADLPPQ